jgi:hypothetical protein
VESYLGVDSLGFQMAKNDDYDMEERVRDNSYVLFLIGIFIDHAYFCFAYLEDIKTCHKLTDVASQWVIDVTMVRPPLVLCSIATLLPVRAHSFRFALRQDALVPSLEPEQALHRHLLGSFPRPS